MSLQGGNHLLSVEDHVLGMRGIDVHSGLRLHFVDECLQDLDRNSGLAAVNGALGGSDFGEQAVGHARFSDVTHGSRVLYTHGE